MRTVGDCEAVLAQFAKTGIDVDARTHELQREGAAAFVMSWTALMKVSEDRREQVVLLVRRPLLPMPVF